MEQGRIFTWDSDGGSACMSCLSDVLQVSGSPNPKGVLDDMKLILDPSTKTIETLMTRVIEITPNLDGGEDKLSTTAGLLTCVSTEECSAFIPQLKNDLIVFGNQQPEKNI
tara:strand:- start:439 stop:771 length:333 start_codon:yes stop_codon:yes gene_type:complete